jgi:hypothetical protein
MDIGYGHTRRSGRSGTHIIILGKALTVQWFAATDGWSDTKPEWGRRSRKRHGRWICRSPHSPAHGLFQSQFAATAFSDNGVRVSFKADGGVKQTFAIRGHLVDLMNDAEENDEGSEWSVLGDFFRASDLR